MSRISPFVLCLVVAAALSSACDQKSGSQALPRDSFAPGDAAIVNTPGSGDTWIATTSDAADRLSKAIAAQDQAGVQELHQAGELLVVSNGSAAKVIAPGLLRHEIRILSGRHAGRSGIVVAEYVTRPTPTPATLPAK